MTSRPRVLIIDDHKLFAEAIRSTLEELGLEVLEPAHTAAEGVAEARRERPHLVLVDIGLPDESGLTLGRRLLSELPGSRVVAVTSRSDPEAVSEALRLGFHGYLTKTTAVRQFLASIRAVLDGRVVAPRKRPQTGGSHSPEERHAEMLIRQLTSRERVVLELLAEGASSSEIAQRLSISPNTVRTHIQNVLVKLHVHSRLEAAAFAVRHGVVRVPGPVRNG
jgi:two-component system nitrate/nitrite response regulator NarL